MFIRTRRRADATYWQACESYRDQYGRPRQRVLVTWNDRTSGPDIARAIAVCERLIAQARAEAKRWRDAVPDCYGPTQYNCLLSRHRNVIERDAVAAERRLAREEARLLALRRVAAAMAEIQAEQPARVVREHGKTAEAGPAGT